MAHTLLPLHIARGARAEKDGRLRGGETKATDGTNGQIRFRCLCPFGRAYVEVQTYMPGWRSRGLAGGRFLEVERTNVTAVFSVALDINEGEEENNKKRLCHTERSLRSGLVFGLGRGTSGPGNNRRQESRP